MGEVTKVIYTDGGCYNNGDWTGAWAFVEIDPMWLGIVVPKEHLDVHIISKGCDYEYDTTNNRMEMKAIINAIRSCNPGDRIRIFSDSGYCVNGHNHPSYLQRWSTNGWITSNKKPVENRDLWEEMMLLDAQYHVEYNLIKGHSKDKTSSHRNWNNLCDKMCTQMRLYATKRVTDRNVKIPAECPNGCKYRDQFGDQGGMCYRCPVILCKDPEPVVPFDDYRDDWLVEWDKFFKGEVECPTLYL